MKPTIKEINKLIKKVDSDQVSDGFHTFGELYDHRVGLYIALCAMIAWYDSRFQVWKSKKHSDGSVWDDWFIMGIGTKAGQQITYHVPIEFWKQCFFARTRARAYKYDGHTSKDALERLKKLYD